MTPGELGAIVGNPLLPQEQSRPRMVQAGVVQHDQARVAQSVGPDVIVMRRIAELVDHEVVGIARVAPHEIVGGPHVVRRVRRSDVNKNVDPDAAAASTSTSSALRPAMPVLTGGNGLNQARRMSKRL